MNNINKIDKTKCTGCGACYSKCPKKAITMNYNAEGFLYPTVEENCVNCGICLRSCPVESPVSKNDQPDAYAVWADEETRKTSSSGGFFSILANYVLDNGGVVCGAAYTEDYSKVVHKWVHDKKDLFQLRGSKYLQSEIGQTYLETKEFLKKGTLVLYSGCPCQIAGLKRFLGSDYDNLILVDIVCHGVPSPAVYSSYLKEKANGAAVSQMNFREKAYWGWGTAFSLFLDNGSVYRNDCFKDPYLKNFLNGMITRKSCQTCAYTSMNRVGDITLGDFWGVSAVESDLDDKKGTSLVLINTSKGKDIFENVRKRCTLLKNVPIEKVIEIAKTRNGRLLCPTPPNSKREEFFKAFAKENQSFERALNGLLKKYDVGYVGWWDSMNYGSALTSFAMNRTLRKMGKTVLMLEHSGIKKSFDSYGLQFARHFYQCSEITDEKDFKRFNNVCDTFLVGSDQLWNWWNIRNDAGFFFLNFAYNEHKKISYATSFGMDETDFPEDMRLRVGYLLSKFDAISVREKSGVDVCKNEFGVEATHVLDPVFLCDMDSYQEVVELSNLKPPKEYLFSYILDPTEDKIDMVRQTANKLGIPYKIAIDALGDNDEESKRVSKELVANNPNVVTQLRIEDWLSHIKNASYIVTDSFHGFCFSIIFNKPTIAYINPRRGAARFESIVQMLGLESRLITNSAQIEERKLIENDIDYTCVNKKLDGERKHSMEWLENAFKKPIRKKSVQELLLWKCIEHDRKINENNIGSLRKEIDELKEQIRQLMSENR